MLPFREEQGHTSAFAVPLKGRPRANSRGWEFDQSSALRANDQVDIAIQNMKEREKLVDRLTIVGLVEQAVELCRRGTQPPDDFAPAQPASGDPLLRFEGQSIEELVPQIPRVLIVIEDLIDVDRALLSGGESIGETFPADFGVGDGPDDRVV